MLVALLLLLVFTLRPLVVTIMTIVISMVLINNPGVMSNNTRMVITRLLFFMAIGLGHILTLLNVSNIYNNFIINITFFMFLFLWYLMALLVLLVDGVESLQHLLVGHVGGGLSPHHLVSGGASISNLVHDENLVLLDLGLHFSESINLLSHLSSGISLLSLQVGEDGLLLNVGFFHILAELVHLGLALLVELHLGSGGAAGLIQTLTQLVDLPSQVGPLPLGLGTSLTLGLEFLLHGLDTALNLLDSLLGLGDKVLLVVKLGSKLRV